MSQYMAVRCTEAAFFRLCESLYFCQFVCAALSWAEELAKKQHTVQVFHTVCSFWVVLMLSFSWKEWSVHTSQTEAMMFTAEKWQCRIMRSKNLLFQACLQREC